MLHDPRPPHLLRKAAENKALHSQEHAAGWTEERINLLKKRWGEGASASEIALELGGGVTRSAVIGKVHRLKLEKRAGIAAPQKPKRNGNKGQPKAIAIQHRAETRILPPRPLPVEEDGVDVTHLLGILQINEHTCKWPIGDPLEAGFGFCGEHTREGSRYCRKHHRRAHIRL
jgi:GcrA cell cycle regulator